MPESKQHAKERAKKLGFNQSQVVKGEEGYFIAPRGVTSTKAKKAYAKCREGGGDKDVCSAVSHNIQKKNK